MHPKSLFTNNMVADKKQRKKNKNKKNLTNKHLHANAKPI